MADVLRIKRRSSGGAGAPASLAYAELAFNEVDNILYYGRGNNAGQAVTIIPIAGPGFVPPATPPGGSNTQVQFNDSGAFGGDAGLTYDKNTDTLTAGDIKVAQWNGVSAPVELKLQSTGGGWGTSILRIKNETGVNGAMFETIPNSGAELVDFVFKVGNITQQNIRLEARPSSMTSGNSWEFQIGSAGTAQFVVGNYLTRTQLLTVKSDGTLNVSISGQTTFQYDPNTNNGTFTLGAKPPHGQVLKFCARSDINGSATFFGAANYNFDAGLFVTGAVQVNADPTTDLQLATKRYVDSKTSVGGASIVVSDTPPASPTDNMLWFESDTGALWLRYNDTTSTQWITISVPPGPITGFLPLTGGTISGNLTISNNLLVQNYMEIGGGQSDGNFIFLAEALISPAGGNSVLRLRKSASGSGNYLIGETGLNTRWQVVLGDPTAETGNTLGSDFVINSFNDAGTFINTPFKITRATSTVTISAVGTNWTVLNLQKSGSGVTSIVYGYNGTTARWGIALGDQIAETGSNVGSNFSVQRFTDAGAYVDSPLNINRSTGVTTLIQGLVKSTGWASFGIDKATGGNAAVLTGSVAGSNRWWIYLGDSTSESGSNAGSNFGIVRWNDAGASIDTPFQITRSNGIVTLSNSLNLPNCGSINISNTSGVAQQVVTLWSDNKTFFGTDAYPARVRGTVIELYTGTTPPTGGCIRFGLLTGAWGITSLPASAGTTYPNVYLTSAGGVIGSISTSDTATGFNNASDGRLKEDLRDFDAGSIIDATKVYDFAWKVNGARAHGIVAQEAVEVYPEAVTHDAYRDVWFIDYSKYVPILLQELKALRQRVAILEGRA